MLIIIYSTLSIFLKAWVLLLLYNWYLLPLTMFVLDFATILIVLYIIGLVSTDLKTILLARELDNDALYYALNFSNSLTVTALFWGWVFTYV